jgi:hypothetical protein
MIHLSIICFNGGGGSVWLVGGGSKDLVGEDLGGICTGVFHRLVTTVA